MAPSGRTLAQGLLPGALGKARKGMLHLFGQQAPRNAMCPLRHLCCLVLVAVVLSC